MDARAASSAPSPAPSSTSAGGASLTTFGIQPQGLGKVDPRGYFSYSATPGAHLEDRTLFDLARSVEQTIIRVLDEVKPGRNLRTNVEFYTALVLQSIGLQPTTFVAMFACGRAAGWAAHVIEQHAEDHLIRPQSEYIGPRGLTLAK